MGGLLEYGFSNPNWTILKDWLFLTNSTDTLYTFLGEEVRREGTFGNFLENGSESGSS